MLRTMGGGGVNAKKLKPVTWKDLAKLLPKNDRRPFIDDAYYRKKGVIK